MENTLKICKIREVKTPSRAHDTDAGIDFYVPTDLTIEDMQPKFETAGCALKTIKDDQGHISKFILRSGESVLIPSGIKMKVPEGHMLQFRNKSGIAAKRHLLVGSEIVDVGYEGEAHINLHNVGSTPQEINAGDKIVQGVLVPVNFAQTEVIEAEEELFAGSKSARGEGGFGSSGTK